MSHIHDSDHTPRNSPCPASTHQSPLSLTPLSPNREIGNAAEQFFARKGHLTVPRKHIETITAGEDGSEDQAQRGVSLKLGTWVANQRRRAATLTPERVEQLSEIGMRWA
ncbi:helicase associated domain-containing protein [Streptomyces sp. NPDC058646]|uniref:helicase associated domain-containing protein n=1 Tax=Streptomyces sp. NPDC058646 TaxID=3346574 RepID=UPI0036632F83